MSMNRKELILVLRDKFPSIKARTTEEFDGEHGGIWVTGDYGVKNSKGKKLFDYYSQDHSQKSHNGGVRVDLHNFLDNYGWYGQWSDAGTIMLWKK